MVCVKSPFKLVTAILGVQDVFLGKEYRPISFCAIVKKDEYSAAYNTLTGELILLDPEEADLLDAGKVVASEKTQTLIEHWFLVPAEHDDMQLRNEIVDFCKEFKKSKSIDSFIIFPTTDCNARCFYCFELGKKHLHMSEKIAKDTVSYILKNSNGKVSLKWFGGEPLYNDEAIDTISRELRNAGVEYRSHMVTNAYLFDDERVKKAVDLWNLKKVQVTLDGTKEVYNKVKSYIYRDGTDAFETVMDNIERLLKAYIRVSIRLNMDNYNYEDLCVLVDMLHDRFSKYKNFEVYSTQLFELKDRPQTVRTDIERAELSRKWLDLEDKILKLGLSHTRALPQMPVLNRCMADGDSAVLILPDGHLGKCEHYIDSRFIGDIYNGITNSDEVKDFQVRVDSSEICKGCKLYPTCVSLKECPNTDVVGVCDEATRFHKEQGLCRSVEKTVDEYLLHLQK